MPTLKFKPMALLFHRWIGLILTPIFLAIIVSGGILAIKPILQDPIIAGASPSVEASSVLSTLAVIDPNNKANGAWLTEDGKALVVTSNAAKGPNGIYRLESGELVAERTSTFDFFATVKAFHKALLFDAGGVVLYATYAMGIIILLGPLLSWLHLRNTLIGWHLAIGWTAWPLLLMLPLTGILMSFHIDIGNQPTFKAVSPPVSISRSIEIVSTLPDIQGITSARRFKGGNMMVDIETHTGARTYIVDGQGQATQFSGPGIIKSLHEGLWAGLWSGLLNFIIASLLTIVTVTGFISWVCRWRQSKSHFGSTDADILVTYASQTGTGAQLAEATYQALHKAGVKASCMSLAGLQPESFSRYRHVLMIVSTTGDGDLAESGRAFLKGIQTADNVSASFSMLALGDRRYKNFCAGGETLQNALIAAGAKEFMPMVRADGAPQTAWREWLNAVQQELAVSLDKIEVPEGDQPVTLLLSKRIRLDNHDHYDTHETWQIILDLQKEVKFSSGDILMVSPGVGEPERCYSIGNSAQITPNQIMLTVSRVAWKDAQGQPHDGRMSTLLCRDLPLGASLSGAIRHHPQFNLPEDVTKPVIMVATGCGIAPFIGFVGERAHAGKAAGLSWLFFGNRYREGDFLYGELLSEWHKKGALTRLNTVFSRDCADHGHITKDIIGHGREIVSLLRDQNAVLYICGRARLGEGVENALMQALITYDHLSELAARDMIRTWKASGSLRQDLFD